MRSTSFHIAALPLAGARRCVLCAIAAASLVPARAPAQLTDESRAGRTPATPRADTLRLVFVGMRADGDAALPGARLGADEGAHTARMFGRTVIMGVVVAADTALLGGRREQRGRHTLTL